MLEQRIKWSFLDSLIHMNIMDNAAIYSYNSKNRWVFAEWVDPRKDIEHEI